MKNVIKILEKAIAILEKNQEEKRFDEFGTIETLTQEQQEEGDNDCDRCKYRDENLIDSVCSQCNLDEYEYYS